VTSLDVTVADLSVVAGDSADVVVTLTGTHTQDITVDYATSDSAAIAVTDYTADSGSVTIPQGDTTTVPVATLSAGSGDFNLSLSNTRFGNITDVTAVATITSARDTDGYGIDAATGLDVKSSVTINSASVASGTTTDNAIGIDGAIGDPTLSLPSLPSISFVSSPDLTMSDGGSLSPGDYGTVVVPAGSSATMEPSSYNIDFIDTRSGAVIAVSPAGAVVINTTKFDMGDDSSINSGDIDFSSPAWPLNSGFGDGVTINRPGLGHEGSVVVTFDVDTWLQFDWDNTASGDENPSTKIDIGIYRGHDRITYWREVH